MIQPLTLPHTKRIIASTHVRMYSIRGCTLAPTTSPTHTCGCSMAVLHRPPHTYSNTSLSFVHDSTHHSRSHRPQPARSPTEHTATITLLHTPLTPYPPSCMCGCSMAVIHHTPTHILRNHHSPPWEAVGKGSEEVGTSRKRSFPRVPHRCRCDPARPFRQRTSSVLPLHTQEAYMTLCTASRNCKSGVAYKQARVHL